jgi:hypothetical protein
MEKVKEIHGNTPIPSDITTKNIKEKTVYGLLKFK